MNLATLVAIKEALTILCTLDNRALTPEQFLSIYRAIGKFEFELKPHLDKEIPL